MIKEKEKWQLKDQSIIKRWDMMYITDIITYQSKSKWWRFLNEINFIPIKVDESLTGDYIKYERSCDTFFKRLSLIDYFNEIKNI